MKTRLNRAIRGRLVDMVNGTIEPVEEKAALSAAKAKAEATVLAVVGSQFPPEEMAILKKYNCATQTYWWPLLIVNGDESVRYDKWEMSHAVNTEEDRAHWPWVPSTPYGQMKVRIEGENAKVLRAFYDAGTEYAKAARELRAPFLLLISGARYLEQVEEVWAAALKVRPFAKEQLPVISVGPLQDQVRAILEKLVVDAANNDKDIDKDI